MLKIKERNRRYALRAGEIRLKSGCLKTPFFMPDATRGFIKSLSGKDVASAGIESMVVNTFHLYLQPGVEKIKKAGGINKFMSWPGPLLSDSGGFQIFSLVYKGKKMGAISDDGVSFRSPIDGSKHYLTPEKSIQIQFDLGVDMMVCLDDCPPNSSSPENLRKSVERTIAWAGRCRRQYDKEIKRRKLKGLARPLLFAVIQGGQDLELRRHCAEELVKIGFDGYGFGAMPIDENGRFMDEILEKTALFIPANALRFALGIGTPEDIVKCSLLGWDMFDCVIPTREGRHGRLFLWHGRGDVLKKGKKFYKTVNINNSRFARDFSLLKPKAKNPLLRGHTFAYLHHLFKAREALGQAIASANNLEFYSELLEKIRKNAQKF